MYWSPAQMLAHMTVNGASLRTGDLYGSGTISGPERDQRGSLLELSWGGNEPFTLDDGTTRTYLQDGDTVTLRATAGTDHPRRGRRHHHPPLSVTQLWCHSRRGSEGALAT